MKDQVSEPEYIYIPDEEGNEDRFEILFTFERDDTGKKYMFVTPADDDAEDAEEQEVYAFRYEEDGDNLNIHLIEDEEEWDMVEEMFHTIMATDAVSEETDSGAGETDGSPSENG